jgi:tetratricopeptide (TPR) repeat protein
MGKRSKTRQRPQDAARSSVTPGGIPHFWMILPAAAIILAAFWIYWPALHGDWIGDDSLYITHNRILHDPARLWKAWFQPGSFVEYYPIHETLQWFQWKLWHNDTFGYHVTNVLLDITSALLVWRLLHKLGLKFGWLGGLLFVVHPMTVDSVALVNEFKTSLSLPPFLMAMLAWIDYEQGRDRKHYLLALAFFVIAMLCKITMMSFPLVILLYAWWKRGRIVWGDLAHTSPFWAVSIVLAYASLYAGQVYEPVHGPFIPDVRATAPLVHFILIGQIVLFYIARAIFPITPVPVYPRWEPDPSSPLAYLPWLLLPAAAVAFYIKRTTWGRHALLGLGFFLIMLAPFSGLEWISYMKATWILEHLLYIPMIGLIGLAVAAFEQLYRLLPSLPKNAAIGAMAVIIALLAWESRSYAANFTDDATLARYAIRVAPTPLAYIALGRDLFTQQRFYEALNAYTACLKLAPDNSDAENACGECLQMTGDLPGALPHFQRAVQLRPEHATFHCDLATALELLNRLPEATKEYQQAVALDPTEEMIHFDYGLCLAKDGRDQDAIGQYQQALALNPDLPTGHDALGISLATLGRKPEAIAQFQQALQANAKDQVARGQLAKLQGDAGNP